MATAVVIPTLNERDNVPLVVDRLNRVLAGISWEVIFVDDNSPDGTAEVVRGLAQQQANIRVLQRLGRRGCFGGVELCDVGDFHLVGAACRGAGDRPRGRAAASPFANRRGGAAALIVAPLAPGASIDKPPGLCYRPRLSRHGARWVHSSVGRAADS